VRAAGLYPAYTDWVGVFALDANGVVWFAGGADDWSDAERVQEPELIHVARVEAARWSAAMRVFCPTRGADAQACPACHGSGHPPVSARYWPKILCQCAGLGWVPAGWRQDQTSGGRWAAHGLDQQPV
jgi:hypothetical protein